MNVADWSTGLVIDHRNVQMGVEGTWVPKVGIYT